MESDRSLAVLEAHGRAFLESFGLPSTSQINKKKRTAANELPTSPPHKKHQKTVRPSTVSDDGMSEHGEEDQPTQPQNSYRKPAEVIVFNAPAQQAKPDVFSKALRKSTMSSKVSRIVDFGEIASSSTSDIKNVEAEIDRTHSKNDRELQTLLHTSLLSGTGALHAFASSDPSSLHAATLKPAARKKALEGRVLELADRVKLGKGEKTVRKAETKRNVLRIREGMKNKQQVRDARNLDEAKNVGNYHPALKKLFKGGDSDDESAKPAQKRDRGLGLGIGRHTSSGLRLSKDEIAIVQGRSSFSSRGGAIRGGPGSTRGGRGRGRGRGKRH